MPSVFCKCRVCVAACKDPLSKDNRQRPSLYIETDQGNFAIEISPDIRMQTLRHELPIITNYVVSHGHFDHLYGLPELHAPAEILFNDGLNLYCPQAVSTIVAKHFSYIPVTTHVLEPYAPFLLAGVTVTALPVMHTRALDTDVHSVSDTDTFGYLLEHAGQRLAYLADYYEIPEQTKRLVQGADIIVADGTYLFEAMYPRSTYNDAIKSERDPEHLHDSAIIDYASRLGGKAVVYHSISHMPEKFHDELQIMMPQDHYIGFDGLSLMDI